MAHALLRLTGTLLLVLFLVSEISVFGVHHEIELDNKMKSLSPFVADNENLHQINTMINAYRGNLMSSRLVIETNALINTKYRTWKRNVDLINSLLALPKGMNDAGR